jgi:hypothetical protein
MRTTLTLDDDVAEMLNSIMVNEKKTLKKVVNEVLRAGIVQLREAESITKKVYATPALKTGPCQYPHLDSIGEILAAAEGEWHS